MTNTFFYVMLGNRADVQPDDKPLMMIAAAHVHPYH